MTTLLALEDIYYLKIFIYLKYIDHPFINNWNYCGQLFNLEDTRKNKEYINKLIQHSWTIWLPPIYLQWKSTRTFMIKTKIIENWNTNRTLISIGGKAKANRQRQTSTWNLKMFWRRATSKPTRSARVVEVQRYCIIAIQFNIRRLFWIWASWYKNLKHWIHEFKNKNCYYLVL